MERQKVHVILWGFKQDNRANATTENICNVHDVGPITDQPIKNWFVKFQSGDPTLF